MSAVQPFFFDGREVRVVQDEQGEPWFVAKDVCGVLGVSDHHQAVERLDEDERGRYTIPTPRGTQEALAVSESGLYALIFTSRKPEARSFRKWVTGTVLPAIRKTGRFETRPMVRPSVTAAAARIRPSARATVLSCAVRMAALENGGMDLVQDYFAAFCEMVGGTEGLAAIPCRTHYQDMTAHFWQWADACLEQVAGHRERAKSLYASYLSWCREECGVEPASIRVFGAWLSQHFRRHQSNVTYYKGVRLRREARPAA